MNIETNSSPVDLDQAFRALGEPVRLRLLLLLAGGERCVCDLVRALELAQAKVSQQLGVLLKAGLVEVRRQGLWRFYRRSETPRARILLAALDALAHQLPAAADDARRLASQPPAACCPPAEPCMTDRGSA